MIIIPITIIVMFFDSQNKLDIEKELNSIILNESTKTKTEDFLSVTEIVPTKVDIDKNGNVNFDIPKKEFTSEEWEEMIKNDPVLQFVEKVNNNSVNNPVWENDFRRAHYEEFNKSVSEHCIKTYNNGEGFIIKGVKN